MPLSLFLKGGDALFKRLNPFIDIGGSIPAKHAFTRHQSCQVLKPFADMLECLCHLFAKPSQFLLRAFALASDFAQETKRMVFGLSHIVHSEGCMRRYTRSSQE